MLWVVWLAFVQLFWAKGFSHSVLGKDDWVSRVWRYDPVVQCGLPLAATHDLVELRVCAC